MARDAELELAASRRGAAPEDATWVARRLRGTHHAMSSKDENRLACGRLMDDSYETLSARPLAFFPACRACFGNRLGLPPDGNDA